LCLFRAVPSRDHPNDDPSSVIGDGGWPLAKPRLDLAADELRFTAPLGVAVKTIFTTVFVLFNMVGFIRKRIGLEIITASLLLLCVDISLLGGSMDRMHIGVIMALLVVGTSDRSWGFRLGWIYCIGSLTLMAGYGASALITGWNREVSDGLFVFVFVIYVSVLLTIRSTRSNPTLSAILA